MLDDAAGIPALVERNEEKKLGAEERGQHPADTRQERANRAMPCGGDVEVHSTPDANDHRAQAEGENADGPTGFWLGDPQNRSGSSACA